MRKSTVILTAGLSLLALSNLWLVLRLGDERARNAELRAQIETRSRPRTSPSESASRDTVSGKVTVAVQNAPAERDAVPPEAAVSRADPAAASGTPSSGEDWQARERRLLSDPKYREARKGQRRLELARWYDEAIRILGMSPAQAEQVLDLVIERELDWSGRPNPRDETELAQRLRDIEESKRAHAAALAAIVGESKATQWEQYVASQPSRSEVRQLRAQLSTTIDPLRDDQVEPLVAALAVEREQLSRELQEYSATLDWEGGNAEPARSKYERYQAERMAAADGRAYTAAGMILSQQQLQELELMRKRQREMHQARERMMRAKSELKQQAIAKAP
jgi:hypothetical protein